MRITFLVADDNRSGGVRVVAEHARRLTAKGHEVLVVIPGRRRHSLGSRLRWTLRGKTHKFRSGPGHLAAAGVTVKCLEKWRPIEAADMPDADVAIATWWETAEWLVGMPPEKGAKVYYVQDYGAPNQTLGDLKRTWRYPMRLVTISRWLQDLIREEAQREADLAPNGVDRSVYDARPRTRPDPFIVGTCASGAPQKGTDLCVRAMRTALVHMPQLRFTAFGRREPPGFRQLGGSGTFVQRPSDVDAAEIYGSCGVWLFGSRREGFGLPILEAMACRTPVVATRAGAAPELLETGAGRLIDIDAEEAMVEAILHVASISAEEWHALSAEAYAQAGRFSWEHAANAFEGALVAAAETNA